MELLNRYGLKGTFNLNSGLQDASNQWTSNGVEIRRMGIEGLPDLYRGHEIACHALTHPHLETLEKEAIEREIRTDRKTLSGFTAGRCGASRTRSARTATRWSRFSPKTVSATRGRRSEAVTLRCKMTCCVSNRPAGMPTGT